ncbi:LOW QUALITY PROTEIN: retinol-binding protein pinta [Diabrotica virgifera virgifera]|uniref:CRAL-TRIO domain-containing protein n=1 Tax=Diabrotica virgifera virgifera TaxID=50390 RepID=A0ABM5IBE3_DIAVI|nr:LOW QUALITY PROTEIN: retinol-binding protein pinta [Diabrotica virgifera virgifera]
MATAIDLSDNQEAKKFAEGELNETDETRVNSLEELKRWLQEEPQLHARLEDQYLLAFLRGSKFNMEKTKKKVKNYYKMRRDVPEWFSNRDPELNQMQELIKLGCFVPLKKKQDNRLVVIIRTAAHNPSIHTQDDVFKAGTMMMDVAAMENVISSHLYGVTAILDMTGQSFAHVRQLTPSTIIGKAVNCWQNYHIRPKHLEFINAPTAVHVVISIFKSFMNSKLRERVRTHLPGQLKDLYTVVDPKILPPEYGGEGETMQELIDYWNDKYISYKSWFLDDEQYKAD